MNEAPEGLDYGRPHTEFAHADKGDSQLEAGKYKTGMASGAEHDAAALARAEKGAGSCDPYYEHMQKNKG